MQVYAVLALWILVFANDLENTENEVEQARTEALRSHRSAMEDEATLSAADAVATLTPDDLARAADGGKPPKGFVLVMGAVRDPNTGVVLPISGLTQALPCSPSCVCWWDAAQRGAKPTSCLSNPTSCSKCWRWMQHGCLRRRSAWFGVWCLLLGTASKHCQPTHRLTCHACVCAGRGFVAVGTALTEHMGVARVQAYRILARWVLYFVSEMATQASAAASASASKEPQSEADVHAAPVADGGERQHEAGKHSTADTRAGAEDMDGTSEAAPCTTPPPGDDSQSHTVRSPRRELSQDDTANPAAAATAAAALGASDVPGLDLRGFGAGEAAVPVEGTSPTPFPSSPTLHHSAGDDSAQGEGKQDGKTQETQAEPASTTQPLRRDSDEEVPAASKIEEVSPPADAPQATVQPDSEPTAMPEEGKEAPASPPATAKPTVDIVSPDQSRVMSPQPSPESPMRPTDLTMSPRDLIPTLTAKQLATAAAERKPPRAFVLVMGAVRVGGGLACVGCGCDLMLWWLWLAAVRIVFEERKVGCRGGAVGVSDLC